MRKFKKQIPPNWEPPVPAWSARIDSTCKEVVICYIGYQIKIDDALSKPESFMNWYFKLLEISHAPIHTERGEMIDNQDYSNDFFISYWNSKEEYQKWRSSPEFNDWWNSNERLNGEFGYWCELMIVPIERFETLFSTETKAGAATMFDEFEGPVKEHNYFGGMRDRLKISEVNLLESNIDNLTEQSKIETFGRRIRVKTPKNLAVIRSAQNTTFCKEVERKRYLNEVYPNLIKGMEYISNNPKEVGCCSSRFSQELTLKGEETKRTFGFAYFLTLGHLEKWSKTHPTHLAIFNSFLKMAQEIGEIDLKLWHEVSVLPEGQIFEYVNCHPRTGLLPWFN